MIECYPYTTDQLDVGFWVPVKTFRRYFSQKDLIHYRAAKNVDDAYSHAWFCVKEDGKQMFELPTTSIVDGETQFISGRHRTSVLLKHVDILPIAFDHRALSFAENLKLESIDLSKAIKLPSLPMKEYPPVFYTE